MTHPTVTYRPDVSIFSIMSRDGYECELRTVARPPTEPITNPSHSPIIDVWVSKIMDRPTQTGRLVFHAERAREGTFNLHLFNDDLGYTYRLAVQHFQLLMEAIKADDTEAGALGRRLFEAEYDDKFIRLLTAHV